MKKIKIFIRKLLSRILPLGNVIIFESVPDLSDNTKAVFDEMIKRGMNKKYKLVWIVDSKNHPKIKNVKYINWDNDKWARASYLARAKAIICCNLYIETTKKGQCSFYLSHGMPVKSTKAYYAAPANIDYFFCTSDKMKKILAQELVVDENKMFGLGYPRNDVLVKTGFDVKKYFNVDCDKVLVWYPTFRQHKFGIRTGSQNALPVIHDSQKANRLNEIAKLNNILIVLKPHFAQDIGYIKDLGLSNICFIDDGFFVENKISSYEFVASCDGLLSDYSSIYYDFLLCNKPIGLIWEDIEEYMKKPGLIDDYEYWMQGGEKIYTLDDFERFISNIANGIDILSRKRNEMKKLVHCSDDGKSAERVVDFIIEKSNL